MNDVTKSKSVAEDSRSKYLECICDRLLEQKRERLKSKERVSPHSPTKSNKANSGRKQNTLRQGNDE